jgi:hypothetical protein
MQNSDLDKFILQLGKIKKKLETISSALPEQVISRPYEFESSILEIKKILNTPPLSDTLKDSNLYKELIDFTEQELQKVSKFKEEFHFNLGTRFKELFTGFGEIKGQLPILRIKFYTIKLNYNIGEAQTWWGPEKELIDKNALEPGIVFQTIKTFDDNLTKIWNSPEDFLKVLKFAYERYIKINNSEINAKVNLMDLLPEIAILMQGRSFKIDPTKSHYSEYSRIHYSFDLYRLKTTQQNQNIQLSVATFAITEDRSKSLWVPDNENGEGTYFQSIAFK